MRARPRACSCLSLFFSNSCLFSGFCVQQCWPLYLFDGVRSRRSRALVPIFDTLLLTLSFLFGGQMYSVLARDIKVLFRERMHALTYASGRARPRVHSLTKFAVELSLLLASVHHNI